MIYHCEDGAARAQDLHVLSLPVLMLLLSMCSHCGEVITHVSHWLSRLSFGPRLGPSRNVLTSRQAVVMPVFDIVSSGQLRREI